MYERRFVSRVSIRASETNQGPIISGLAARFGVVSSDLGGFREKILPGAFSKSLRSGQDVVCLLNHSPNELLGRTTNRTLALKEDGEGLRFSCILPDTSTGRDVYQLVRTGTLADCSFAFTAEEQSWDSMPDPDADPTERKRVQLRILHTVRLWDVSVVTQPAYQGTSVTTDDSSANLLARGVPYAVMFPEGVPMEIRSRVRDFRYLSAESRQRRRELFSFIMGL